MFKALFTAFSLSFMRFILSLYICCSELSASQDFPRTRVFKGAVSSRFVKTSLKLRLNAFIHTQNAPGTSMGRYQVKLRLNALTHTQNAPGTSRGRYQVNFCKESKP